MGITKDPKDGYKRVKGDWVSPLKSSIIFMKLRGKVYATWCLGCWLVKRNCVMVLFIRATNYGLRKGQNDHQRLLRRIVRLLDI